MRFRPPSAPNLLHTCRCRCATSLEPTRERGLKAMAGRATARIDVGAIERNCARLAELGMLCAVVKADGYGHGAYEAALAAQRGGAEWLAVATAGEAATLRDAGIAGPLLVMGALTSEELDVAI